jgi:hypothetical protein
MNAIKENISVHLPGSQIEYTPAKYPLLQDVMPAFLTALIVVGIGCDVLPGGIDGITPLEITKELKWIENDGVSAIHHTR